MIKPFPVGKILLTGALAGGLTSLPVMGLNALGPLAGLAAFLPYVYFDWLVRALPGWIVVPGLEGMLSLLGRLGFGPVDAVAKTAEHGLALALFIGLGVVMGALIGLLGRALRRAGWLAGPLWGVLLIGMTAAIESSSAFSGDFSFPGRVLQALLLLGWGALLGWIAGRRESGKSPDTVDYSRRWILGYLAGGTFGVFLAWTGLEALLTHPAAARVASAPTIPPAAGPPATPTLIQTAATQPPAPTQTMGAAEKADHTPPQTAVPAATSAPVAVTSSPEALVQPDADVEPDTPAARAPAQAGADGRILPAPGTRVELTSQANFYQVDIDIDAPAADPAAWRLTLDGLVGAPQSFSLDQVRARPSVRQTATFSCISNTLGGRLISTAEWTGARLGDLLKEVGLQPGAVAVRIEALDGYYESAPLNEAMDERTLLLYEMNGAPLSADHGFPLRIFIPGHYGMKQPKWITHLKVIDQPGTGFWSDRGWSRTARVNTMSSIDSVNPAVIDPATQTVPVGGIAYAGDRGILRVEVQVDRGPWAAARLRNPPLSRLSWVQWRYNYPYRAGRHTIRVRATDGNGQVQTSVIGDIYPNGATGWTWKDVDM